MSPRKKRGATSLFALRELLLDNPVLSRLLKRKDSGEKIPDLAPEDALQVIAGLLLSQVLPALEEITDPTFLVRHRLQDKESSPVFRHYNELCTLQEKVASSPQEFTYQEIEDLAQEIDDLLHQICQIVTDIQAIREYNRC